MTRDQTRSNAFEAGLKVRREVLGAEHVDASMSEVSDFSRPMQELVTEYCWGVVWDREGLPRKTRSLLNLAMLTALNRPHEFAVHVRGALTNGATESEIQEVLLQTAIYVGVPAALESFRIADRILKEHREIVIADGSETIAFIGLGNMGLPMVRRLLAAGRVVHAHDVQAGARERAADAGAAVRGDLGQTVADADVVILMLPDSVAVSAVLGDPELLAALRAGSIVVDMSSSEPDRTRALGADLAGRGVAYVDAPVSGGVSGAERGTLAIMVGGADDDVDRVSPILSNMGRILRAGPLGAGHAVKSLNNLLSATHLWITCEAIVAGERFGLEPAAMLRIFNESSGRSGSTENKWPNFILDGSYASGFGLRLMLKDIGIAVGLASRTGSLHDLGEAVVSLWARAANEMPATADHTEVARWIAEAADDPA